MRTHARSSPWVLLAALALFATAWPGGRTAPKAPEAAVLALGDAGLVDLDDPLTDCVPEYSPPGSEGVTLRRLLSHSAGVPDLGPDLCFFPNDKGATIRFVRDGEGRVIGHVFHQLGLDERAVKIAGTRKEG